VDVPADPEQNRRVPRRRSPARAGVPEIRGRIRPKTKTVVTRRSALRTLGAGAGAFTLLPLLSEEGLSAFAEVQRAKAPPNLKALSREQYATVEALVEAILPADERSPGAKEARVADYLDLLLSEVQPGLKQEWLDGLSTLDAESSARFGAPFVRLQAAQVESLLTDISRYEAAAPAGDEPAQDSGRPEDRKEKPVFIHNLLGNVSLEATRPRREPLEAFFAITKDATIHGYYTSEIGIHKELRYKGNQILPEFVGCETTNGRDCPHCGQKAEA